MLQDPADRDIDASASRNSSGVISPAFTASENRQRRVPEPTRSPRKRPFSIGPPETRIAGRSHEAAPISSDGVVLSQPASSTTPSIGLPRMHSSTSIAARLRNIIAVGRRALSEAEKTGTSTGRPPASQTPFFTFCARSRRCALQGVSSDQVLRMPITGRPSKAWCGSPWFFIQPRW